MYSFPYYKESDPKLLLEFAQNHPFIFLTGSTPEGAPVVTQVPVMLEERDGRWYIQGHIMRNTDHYKAFERNPRVLAVFSGPHCYVSASWYSDPAIGSTWNYMSIHAHGSLRFLAQDKLVDLMKRFTLKYEGGDKNSPTVYDNLPESFIDKMLPAIAGFEIEVDQLEHTFKLSQNRDEESYRNIISQLRNKGHDDALIAAEMEKRFDQLFQK